jgi:sec-independent protein translocase protein TatC
LNLLRRKKNSLQVPDRHLESGDSELRMGFLEHLVELRKRFVLVIFAVIVTTIAGSLIAGQALDYLREPYCRSVSSPDDCALVILGPTGGIVAYFRVALMIGAGLAMPIIVYQLLMFIVPGMTKKERRVILLSLPAIVILFFIGNAFAWLVLIPAALGFLVDFQSGLFKSEWTAELYLRFVTTLIFWMGVAFETPLVFFVLSLLGIVGPGALIRNWRAAVVGTAIAAALITPTVDPANMFLVMAPLLALYVFSIVLVAIGRRIARVE